MKVKDDVGRLDPGAFRAPVVVLGVFDGVHRGHRRVLERAKATAEDVGGEVVVVTFHVHPRAVTTGDRKSTRLNSSH